MSHPTTVGQLAPEKLPPALSLRGIEVTLGGSPVLCGVDLDVHRGEVLALVGPNGAGKSTLLAVASGDVDADAGSVSLLGEDLGNLAPKRAARLRSVLLQEQRIAFGFTGYEVVEMGRTPWYRHPEEERDEIAIDLAMRRTDVVEFAERRYPTLSGGEKSRVSLARVLAQEAPVVLLDEPTAALDIRHQEQVLATARDLARTGASVVVVLHDLSLAAAWADRICVMSRGEVRALGTPREVLVEDVLDEVYQHPLQVVEHAGGLLVVPRREHLVDPGSTSQPSTRPVTSAVEVS
ncbi:iron complex transport system ATP-binding protein [Marmoricola sp. OAE513]|uniref:heme ABC transporter ATP-binding protein n=1 Tax=Marmoricola sp. OAE513 TaxID=2817894 RepID=UPI001D926CD0